MNKFVYISDVHVPYFDTEMLREALNLLKKEKNVDTVILGGDLIDFYKISSYSKNPLNHTTFADEVAGVKAFLYDIRKIFKKADIYYLEGNHENRLGRYLSLKAPELIGFEPLKFETLFDLAKYDITFIRDTEVLQIEDWVFRHGHELGMGSSIPGNNARKGVAFYGANYIQGHVHKANVLHISTLNSDFIGIESPHLAEQSPNYVKGYAQWQQGYTVVEKDDYNKWQVKQKIL